MFSTLNPISRYRLASWLIAGLIICATESVHAQQGPVGPDPKTVSVFYAGRADSPRMDHAKKFLEKYFAKVRCRDIRFAFRESEFSKELRSYDVVILDWPRMSDELAEVVNETLTDKELARPLNGFTPPAANPLFEPAKKVFTAITKPVVSIGIAPYLIPNNKDLDQMPWRSPVIGDYAHDTNMSHPIFQGPLPVDIKQETIDKPIAYFLSPGTQKLNETLQAWQVQTKTKDDSQFGLCCDRDYYANTPDAEAISCGTAEAPNSVTIGRYGNYLIWSYTAEITNMTAAAQAAFVNSICYMKSFGKVAPEPVSYQPNPRREFLKAIYYLRCASNEFTRANQTFIERHDVSALDTLRKYDFFDGSDKAVLRAKREQSEHQEDVEQYIKFLPRDIRDEFHGDVEALIGYYSENYDHLYLDARHRYVVDEDAKPLGIPNYSPDFLKKCIDLLAAGGNQKLALTLLKRYVGKSIETPADWQAWYDSEGKNWVFDESQTKFVAPTLSDK